MTERDANDRRVLPCAIENLEAAKAIAADHGLVAANSPLAGDRVRLGASR